MPKSRTFDFVVPGTPAEVAKRLEAQTRFRPFFHQSSVLGKGGFGGRVSESGFAVSDDPSTMVRRLQAVASGTFEDRGDGTTRVTGTCGMPTWVTWALRLGSLWIPVFAIGGLLAILADGEVSSAPVFALMTSIFAAIAVLVVGASVNQVEAGVDPLVDRIEESLRSVGGTPESAADTESAAVRRARERAMEG
ncbi:MAG: hypothetical protein H6737_27955 [Alphaproteobacteria bacterium]|nr:hypothetical protein [Alphaproteobacteria bacterium]